jgi:hypothetical protein
MDLLATIPGYSDAVDRERVSRDASFLPLTENVAGFECLPMTLSTYIAMRLTNNPVLYAQPASESELVAFLWLLSPSYSTDKLAAKRFARRCRVFIPPPLPWLRLPRAMARWERLFAARQDRALEVWRACCQYVAETFQDSPPSSIIGIQKSYYSDAASICATLGREYHWPEAAVLAMPIKRVFQYLNELKAASPAKIPLGNPSDVVLSRWTREQNKTN